MAGPRTWRKKKSHRLSWVRGCGSKRERRDPGQERWRREGNWLREGERVGEAGEGVGKSERVSLSLREAGKILDIAYRRRTWCTQVLQLLQPSPSSPSTKSFKSLNQVLTKSFKSFKSLNQVLQVQSHGLESSPSGLRRIRVDCPGSEGASLRGSGETQDRRGGGGG